MVELNVSGIENGEALLLAHLDPTATPYDPRGRSWIYPKLNGWHTFSPGAVEGFLLSTTTRSIAVTDSAVDDDFAILASAAGGAGDIDLPTAVGRHGKLFVAKKTDATTNIVTVNPDGAETIDGVATKPLVYQNETVAFISDNVNWQILWQTPTMQEVYNVSTVQPKITLTAGNGGLDIRDAATPIGASLLRVANNAATTTFIDVSATDVQIGTMGVSEAGVFPISTTKDSLRLLPDVITDSTLPTSFGLLQWDSTYTANFTSARFGGMIYAIGFARFQVDANPFNGLNLFLNAATIKNVPGNAVSLGSDFTLIDQPRYEADGAACTLIQHNGIRSFPAFQTAGGGTLTITNSYSFICGAIVSPGATLVNRIGLSIFSPVVTGTLTNNIGIDINDQLTGTNRFGIRSAMATGTFIQHNGVALSTFAGDIHMNDGVSLTLGSVGSTGVELFRSAASALTMQGFGDVFNEGLTWQFEGNNNVRLTSGTGASLNINTVELAFGPGVTADGTNNWVMAFAPGLRSTQSDGDYAEVLFTSSSAISIANAIVNFATWTVNAPPLVITGGSIVSAANVIIQGNMTQGTNRYGLLVTSDPTGGTLNYAARFTGVAGVRIDGLFEHTGVLFGIHGAAPVAQSPAYSITNVTTDRTLDANATSLNELADAFGTLVADLQLKGIIG